MKEIFDYSSQDHSVFDVNFENFPVLKDYVRRVEFEDGVLTVYFAESSDQKFLEARETFENIDRSGNLNGDIVINDADRVGDIHTQYIFSIFGKGVKDEKLNRTGFNVHVLQVKYLSDCKD